MRQSLFIFPVVLLSLSTFAVPRDGNAILAKNEDGVAIRVAVDTKGVARVDENPNSHPSIKEFRDDSGLSEVCYIGTGEDAIELVEALIAAADGDGDSFVVSSDVSLTLPDYAVKAKVTLEDESGFRKEVYTFARCK